MNPMWNLTIRERRCRGRREIEGCVGGAGTRDYNVMLPWIYDATGVHVFYIQ
jgi:hypothetical protein